MAKKITRKNPKTEAIEYLSTKAANYLKDIADEKNLPKLINENLCHCHNVISPLKLSALKSRAEKKPEEIATLILQIVLAVDNGAKFDDGEVCGNVIIPDEFLENVGRGMKDE